MAYSAFYIGTPIYFGKSPYGYEEVSGLENYVDASPRNKVVYRLDMLYAINDMFEESTIDKFRNVIYGMVSGNIKDKVKLAELFKELYLFDKKFHIWCGAAVTFEGAGQTKSLYAVFIDSVRLRMMICRKSLDKFYSVNVGHILYESKLYLYVGDDDNTASKVIPKALKGEVLTNAKKWNGKFSRQEWVK